MRLDDILQTDWEGMIRSKQQGSTLKNRLNALDAPTAATVLEQQDDKTIRAALFRLLDQETGAEVFSFLDFDEQNELLQVLSTAETTELLTELAPEDTSMLLDELPEKAARRLFDLMDSNSRKRVQQLLAYPKDSIGRIMVADFIAVTPDMRIHEVLYKIRQREPNHDAMLVIYVVAEDWTLLDAIDLREFLISDPNALVADIMDNQFISVSAYQDQEDALKLFMHYDLTALPILSRDEHLLGSVTYDDLFDVQEEEYTEDTQKQGGMGAIGSVTETTSYRLLYKARIGWLVALVFLNIPSGALLGHFESVLAQAAGLLLFLPLLIASGGNAGTQSATLMVRALATDDISMADWSKLFARELVVASALGLTMALTVSALGLMRGGVEIALIAASAMLLVVLLGALMGMSLPLLLSKLKVDPAVASAPLVTAIADIGGVLIYFSIARYVLSL